MPEEHGGAGLGVTEAALMMHAVAGSSGAMSAASAIHLNIFGPHPIVVFGTDKQKKRWLSDLIQGKKKSCFGVTEPDAGLNTTSIKTRADRSNDGYVVHGKKIWTSSAQVADKIMLLVRTAAVDSNEVFIDALPVPLEDRIGEEGEGFRYLLHSLNPERVLMSVEAIGIGQNALSRATQYAKDREVFDRPIGKNQSIQHPLAQSWMELEAAFLMAMRAASLYDSGESCGVESNAAKYLGAEAGFQACTRAVMTHGGMGYAKEYHVERLLREVMITRLAPVSPQLILCNIAEKALGLPKSY
jgi:acyl-CoA dehydrogenase